MTDYVDVPLNILRVDGYELATPVSEGETLQLMRLTFPDASQSPVFAFTNAQWSDLIVDMQRRLHAGLEDEQQYQD